MGRRDELARLDAALAGLRAGVPKVLEIVGEPGIGKTRLLAELSVRAQRDRRLVLAGRAAEFERKNPFGVVVEALDDHLASVFPALVAQRTASACQIERYRLHRAVRVVLEQLAQPRGLVLVLDDLHWAATWSGSAGASTTWSVTPTRFATWSGTFPWPVTPARSAA